MSLYPSVVLEHFRHPRNQGLLAGADVSVEGANPLCGDRVRLEVRVAEGAIVESAFTADACALCVASASLLTEHVRGMRADDVRALGDDVALTLLRAANEEETVVPPARRRCVTLPLETLRRGLRMDATRPR